LVILSILLPILYQFLKKAVFLAATTLDLAYPICLHFQFGAQYTHYTG
jgi:hypothetical protein